MTSALVLALLLGAAPTVESPDERLDEPYALTISGGVSLGSYEAGLNWALVRVFRAQAEMSTLLDRRRPQLVAVTGASAGSINALLVAALYCEASDSTSNASVDANLLRDSWLPVSLDALLPDKPNAYRRDDAVMASSALDPVVAQVRSNLFGGAMRFRPGCRIPMGLTVTRVRPLEQDIGGLRTLSQRAVLPLIFEVDETGRVHFRRQPLPGNPDAAESRLVLADSTEMGSAVVHPDAVLQSLLASAAFPVVFRPRVLCECATSCGADPEVEDGTCPGPDDARPLTGLSCSAQSGGQEMKICRRRFVDGGVFDNAPIGLALEQSEAFWRPRVMRPLTALFVDPDIRRLSPRGKTEQVQQTTQGFSGVTQFASDLVSTARNRELARAVEAGRWNLTTRSLLQSSARNVLEYLGLLGELVDLDGPPPPATVPPALHASVEERARIGRTIVSCLERLGSRRFDAASVELASRCAGSLRGERVKDPLDDDPRARVLARKPLDHEEAAELVSTLGRTIANPASVVRQSIEQMMRDPATTTKQRIEMGRALADRLQILSVLQVYLAEQLGPLSHGTLPEERLIRLRNELLDILTQGEVLGPSAARVAAAQLEEALTALAGRKGPGTVPQLAREALADLHQQAPGKLFSIPPLLPLLTKLGETPADQIDASLFRAWQHLDRLVQLRPRLQRLAGDTATVAQDARALRSQATGERALGLSTRFSPLAGSQLFNFAGFLDRPLREMDYYAGIYDGLHAAAEFVCGEQEVSQPGRPVPIRLPGSWSVDLRQTDSQLCIGASLGQVVKLLGVLDSVRAATFVRALARSELAAWLGSSAEAERLLRTPQWSWIGPPSDLRRLGPSGVTLWVLLSQKAPCNEASTEALCIGELTFDDFLSRLVEAGYVPESPAMRLALEDRRRFWQQTARRGLDRAATIELTASGPSETGQRQGVLFAISAGELWTRADVNGTSTRFTLDPSTIPTVSLADGPTFPIVLAHLLPYRVALDVAKGGLAMSWIEPALRVGPYFSVLSTAQLVDIEFGKGRTSTTFGLRPTVHLGGLSVSAGPRFAVHWSGGTAWGGELGISILQDRLGISAGVRSFSGEHDVFVALTVSDVNGMVYWLTPWAKRPAVQPGAEISAPARPTP